MATFLETPRFPDDIAYGSTGGPGYNTDIETVDSGHEQRNIDWLDSRAEYDVSHGVKTQTQLNTLIKFFRSMKGRAYGFRFKDHADFQATSTEGILTQIAGNYYQMYKRYITGTFSEDRLIQKPVSGSITVYDNGTPMGSGFSIDYTTGIINITSGSGPFTWAGQFDVPVRFDTDQMKVNLEHYNHFTWGQIPIIEIRIPIITVNLVQPDTKSLTITGQAVVIVIA